MRNGALSGPAVLVLFFALAATVTAIAQEHESVTIGISTSEYWNETSVAAEPGELFWLYVVIENAGFVPSCSVMSWVQDPFGWGYWNWTARWEMVIEVPDNIWVVNFDSSYGGAYGDFNQYLDPEILYLANLAYNDPTQIESLHGDRMTLVRIGVMPLDNEPALLYLKSHPHDRCGTGLPCYH